MLQTCSPKQLSKAAPKRWSAKLLLKAAPQICDLKLVPQPAPQSSAFSKLKIDESRYA
jgi:hypothetical protein